MSRTVRLAFVGAVGGLVILAVAVTAVYTFCIRPTLLLLRDKDNMSSITRNLDYSAFPEDEKGQRVFPDQLKLSHRLSDQSWECPFCGQRYVYRAVNMAGERITHGFSRPYHFVMWCPCEHPDGERVFMMKDLGMSVYSDWEVSWYYQKLAEDLGPQERKQENLYRVRHKLLLLQQPGE